MNLFIEYFYFKDEQRNKEVFETIEKNCLLNCIDKIYAVAPTETLKYLNDQPIGKNSKVISISRDERCSFQMLFDLSKNYTSDDDISCVANNDIIFTDDFNKLKDKLTNNDFYCISRREYHKQFTMGFGKWSQDVWCWKGKCKMENCNFYFGVPGNDNTIPYHAEQAGYKVKNPSLTFKCFHNHKSNIRPNQEFLESIRLDRTFYQEVMPCEV